MGYYHIPFFSNVETQVILVHTLSSSFILLHPLSSSFILFQPLSSYFNLFHPLSSSFILFRHLSSSFILFLQSVYYSPSVADMFVLVCLLDVNHSLWRQGGLITMSLPWHGMAKAMGQKEKNFHLFSCRRTQN